MTTTARATGVATVATFLTLAASVGAAAKAPLPEPAIDAPAGILVDAGSGEVITARSPRVERPIASTTKLMTALLALESAELDDVFTAPRYEAAPVESKIDLAEGERMAVRDLLAALLLESANDAAATIAKGVSGSEAAFVEAMNVRARELGLSDTHYENPIGFDDPGNYSSPRDLATLATYLLRDRRFARIVDRPRAVLETGARRRVVENRNSLVAAYPEVDGVKTGHTAGAGWVLVGASTARDAGVVSVVLGASSEEARDGESRELLEYGMSLFERRSVLEAGGAVATADVRYSGGDRAALTTPEDVSVTVRRGAGGVETRVSVPAEVEGPLAAESRVGSVEVVYGGEVVETVPLVTASAVPRPSLFGRIAAASPGALTWVLLGAIVVLVTVAGIRARAASRRRTAGQPTGS